MRQMNLELVIQSKVSQKKKDEYRILNIYLEFRKMVLKNLFAGQQWKKTQCPPTEKWIKKMW